MTNVDPEVLDGVIALLDELAGDWEYDGEVGAQTRFIAGLPFGRRIIWEAQQRADNIVPLGEAVRGLWPQLVLGLVFGAALWRLAPGALPWALPTLAGSLLAIPFACVTASPRLGRWMKRRGLCAVPGERDLGA